MFGKQEPQLGPLPPMHKLTICKVCDTPLSWGQFAYKQEVCWGCFKSKIIGISKEVETLEDTEMILHLLSIADRHYNG